MAHKGKSKLKSIRYNIFKEHNTLYQSTLEESLTAKLKLPKTGTTYNFMKHIWEKIQRQMYEFADEMVDGSYRKLIVKSSHSIHLTEKVNSTPKIFRDIVVYRRHVKDSDFEDPSKKTASDTTLAHLPSCIYEEIV